MKVRPNSAMRFYDRFAGKYDLLVSDARYDQVLPFFVRLFEAHHVTSVLDCSCGTGQHVIRFAQRGIEATGSDVSREMIRRARRNAAAAGAEVAFVRADFKRLREAFDRTFDCVVCWGNSLDHELTERGILAALRSMHTVLRDHGILVVQIRNLPKWVREGRRIFPMHFHKEPNGDRRLFIYVLDFHRTRVRFHVLSFLELDGKPTFEVDSVDYRIIPAQRLKELMRKAGFLHVKTHGNVQFGRFNDRRSEEIIVVGRKGRDQARSSKRRNP
ncbi:MAG TPA: class I SAM-dependent methyltransferase [Thermoplasmata archaeon]|nr:class I SAM-dependent methyltransferase [Thermoplasmata archaeon]